MHKNSQEAQLGVEPFHARQTLKISHSYLLKKLPEMFSNDINAFEKIISPTLRSICNLSSKLATHSQGRSGGIWLEWEPVDIACGSEKEAAACQSVVIQVHTPRHLCQLMRETQLCFI